MHYTSSNLFGWNASTLGLGTTSNITTNSGSNANRLTGFIPAQTNAYTLQNIKFYLTNIVGTPVAANCQILVNVSATEQSSFASASNSYTTTNATLIINNELNFSPNLLIPVGNTVAFCLNNINGTPASNYFGVYAVAPTFRSEGGYINHHWDNKLIYGTDTNNVAVGSGPPSWYATTGLNNIGLGLFGATISPIINSNNSIGIQFTAPSTGIKVIAATMYLSRTFPTNSSVPPRYRLTVNGTQYLTDNNNSNLIVSNTSYIEDSLTPITLPFSNAIDIPALATCRLELFMNTGESTNGFTTIVQNFSSAVGTTLTRIQGLSYLAPGSSTPDINKALPFALILDPHLPLGSAASGLNRFIAEGYYQ